VRIDDRYQDIIKAKDIDKLVLGGRHILRGGIRGLCPFGFLGIHHFTKKCVVDFGKKLLNSDGGANKYGASRKI